MKDALATLHRHDIEVKIQSRYGIITLKEEAKTGFKDIVTLHTEITPPENFNMIGTDFGILGCTENDIQMAKSMFYLFLTHPYWNKRSMVMCLKKLLQMHVSI
ncbi:MAG: hypothetical protein ACLTX3_07760 [Lachnospiraceae bacterium]